MWSSCYFRTSPLTPSAHHNSANLTFSRPPRFHPYVKHKDRRVCIQLAAQKPEFQPYTNNTREAVKTSQPSFHTAEENMSSRLVWLLENLGNVISKLTARNAADNLPGFKVSLYLILHNVALWAALLTSIQPIFHSLQWHIFAVNQ